MGSRFECAGHDVTELFIFVHQIKKGKETTKKKKKIQKNRLAAPVKDIPALEIFFLFT